MHPTRILAIAAALFAVSSTLFAQAPSSRPSPASRPTPAARPAPGGTLLAPRLTGPTMRVAQPPAAEQTPSPDQPPSGDDDGDTKPREELPDPRRDPTQSPPDLRPILGPQDEGQGTQVPIPTPQLRCRISPRGGKTMVILDLAGQLFPMREGETLIARTGNRIVPMRLVRLNATDCVLEYEERGTKMTVTIP